MKWSVNLIIILIFIAYFSLSIISTFSSHDVSEVINWIMIVGFLAFFIWMMPKSKKKRNNKDQEG